jgi:serine/threonine protein kinase
MKINNVEDLFDHMEVITEGTYGMVYKATRRDSGEVVAIKKYKANSTHTENGLCITLLREISLLKRLTHPNIVETKQVLVDAKQGVYCVMPFYPRNLKRFKLDNPKTKIGEIRAILRQILEAVAFIHAANVAHRDINPRNILVTDSLDVRICDFGLARLLFPGRTKDLTREIVTLNYRAPEIILGELHYDSKIDMWSIGCVFYELISGKQLFKSSEERGLLIEICQVFGTPNSLTWPAFQGYLEKAGITIPRFEESSFFKLDLINGGLSRAGVDLVRKLLLFDPSRRIDAAGALKHPFFSETDGLDFLP